MSSSLPAMLAVFLSKSTCLQVECRRIERCTNTQKHTKRTHRKRKEKKRSKRGKSEASTKEHTANGKRESEARERQIQWACISLSINRSRLTFPRNRSFVCARAILCQTAQDGCHASEAPEKSCHASEALEKHFRTSIPKQTLTVPPGSSDSFFPLPGTRLPAIESVDSSVVCERNLVGRVSKQE